MANGMNQPVDLLARRRLNPTQSSDYRTISPKRNVPISKSPNVQKVSISSKNSSVQSSTNRNDSLTPSTVVSPNNTIFQACQKMAALRTSSLLVVEESHSNSPLVLVGIVTDKDIAYKVIAEGLDSSIVLISSVMTPNPVTILSDVSMNDALSIMTEKHFRHLPVVSINGEIEGVLDITLAMRSAIERLRKGEELARNISSAVGHVTQNNYSSGADQLINLTDLLKRQLSTPEVSGLFPSSLFNTAATCSLKSTIKNASIVMKSASSTAILVQDESGSLVGIFTTKDIVRRVISAKLDPLRTTMIRVMTPNPETISPNSSLLIALEKMYAGRYLHLPVLAENGSSSLIDILDICVHVFGKIKKEMEFEEIFSPYSKPIACLEDNVDDDTCSITSLETTASSRISISKGNRWTFKVRLSDNLVYIHIQQLQFTLLFNAIKEKLLVQEPFSIAFKDSEGDMIPVFNDDDLVSLIETSLGKVSGLSVEGPLNLYVSNSSNKSQHNQFGIFKSVESTIKKPHFVIAACTGMMIGLILVYRKAKF